MLEYANSEWIIASLRSLHCDGYCLFFFLFLEIYSWGFWFRRVIVGLWMLSVIILNAEFRGGDRDPSILMEA